MQRRTRGIETSGCPILAFFPLARVGFLTLILILISTLILFLRFRVLVSLFLFLSLRCHSAVRNPSTAQISCAAPSFASTSLTVREILDETIARKLV